MRWIRIHFDAMSHSFTEDRYDLNFEGRNMVLLTAPKNLSHNLFIKAGKRGDEGALDVGYEFLSELAWMIQGAIFPTGPIVGELQRVRFSKVESKFRTLRVRNVNLSNYQQLAKFRYQKLALAHYREGLCAYWSYLPIWMFLSFCRVLEVGINGDEHISTSIEKQKRRLRISVCWQNGTAKLKKTMPNVQFGNLGKDIEEQYRNSAAHGKRRPGRPAEFSPDCYRHRRWLGDSTDLIQELALLHIYFALDVPQPRPHLYFAGIENRG